MFDWHEYLVLAEALEQMESEVSPEAKCRAAMSRAYYAAFHCARRYLEHGDPHVDIPSHGGAHERVPELLKRGDRMAKNAAIKLGALKQLRKWADYEPSSRAKLEQELTQAILNARWILNNLEI